MALFNLKWTWCPETRIFQVLSGVQTVIFKYLAAVFLRNNMESCNTIILPPIREILAVCMISCSAYARVQFLNGSLAGAFIRK